MLLKKNLTVFDLWDSLFFYGCISSCKTFCWATSHSICWWSWLTLSHCSVRAISGTWFRVCSKKIWCCCNSSSFFWSIFYDFLLPWAASAKACSWMDRAFNNPRRLASSISRFLLCFSKVCKALWYCCWVFSCCTFRVSAKCCRVAGSNGCLAKSSLNVGGRLEYIR